mgnify:FL=1
MANRKNKQHKGTSPKHNGQKDFKDDFQWKRAGKTSLIWIGIILVAVYLSSLLTNERNNELEIDYSLYREYLLAGDIDKAVIIDKTFHGKFKTPQISQKKVRF